MPELLADFITGQAERCPEAGAPVRAPMKILGVSGLEQSVAFQKAHWPGLDDREYRMCQGYDAAAALVIDGAVVVAALQACLDRVMRHLCGHFGARTGLRRL